MLIHYAVLFEIALLGMAAYAYHKRDVTVWFMTAIFAPALAYITSSVSFMDSFANYIFVPAGIVSAINYGIGVIALLFFFVDYISSYPVALNSAAVVKIRQFFKKHREKGEV